MNKKIFPASEILSKFVADLKFENIPRKELDHLKLSILDTIGCGIYGSTTPWGSTVVDYALEADGPEQTTIWCRRPKVHCSNAVLANGTLVHTSDFDDVYQPTLLHLGCVVLTTALGMAEVVGSVSGEDLLTATASGYEVAINVRKCMGRSLVARGFNGTGVVGPIGAAAAAAKILGLGADKIMHAIGISGMYASGLQSCQRSMSKKTLFGRAAQQGVLGALLAEKGFTGSEVLEANYGGFSAFSDEYDVTKVRDIGKSFTIHNIGFKSYPAAIGIHPALEALRELMNKYPINPDLVEKVIVRQTTHNARYRTGMDPEHLRWSLDVATMSMQYPVACMLIDGEMSVNQLREESIMDPRIVELARKVEVVPTSEFDEIEKVYPDRGLVSKVEVIQEDNTYESELQYYPKGTLQNPMSKKELWEKFKILARTVLNEDRVQDIIRAVSNLEQIEDAAILADQTVP